MSIGGATEYICRAIYFGRRMCAHIFILGINILTFSGRCECCNIPTGRKKPKTTASNLSDGNKLTVTNVKIVRPHQISYESYHLGSQILIVRVPWQPKRYDFFLNGAYLLFKPKSKPEDNCIMNYVNFKPQLDCGQLVLPIV